MAIFCLDLPSSCTIVMISLYFLLIQPKGGWLMVSNVSFTVENERYKKSIDHVRRYSLLSLQDVQNGMFNFFSVVVVVVVFNGKLFYCFTGVL